MTLTQEQEREANRVELIRHYKVCFASESGQAVLAHLKKETHFDSSHLGPDWKMQPDRVLWVDEGRRDFVLSIIAMVEANLEPKKPETALT